MSGYDVKFETVTVGQSDYLIRSLLDRQQYSDPLGDAERAGISPATWPLFGLIWPSSRVLAEAMDRHDLTGKRILEIGAGLALASLVVHRRMGDITASDSHPLSQSFLDENLLLNHLKPLPFKQCQWEIADAELGLFDLIMGSDVLYERDHPTQLAGFIDHHAADESEVIIVDPDRGNRAAFCRQMGDFGFSLAESRADRTWTNGESYKGRFLNFQRHLPAPSTTQ